MDTDKLLHYVQPAGTYFLARDMVKEGIIETIYLDHLHRLICNKSKLEKNKLEKLVGRKIELEVPNWNVRRIELKLGDAEKILGYLKEEYKSSPSDFFERYGSKNGAIFLCRDLKKEGLDLKIKKFHSLIGDSDVISTLLDISDKRFSTNWNPKVIFLNDDESNIILTHLKKRYEQNPDKFFEVYGSDIGTVILSNELYCSGYNMNPAAVSSINRDGRSLNDLLEIDDIRFKREWNPKNIQIPLKNIEALIHFLKEKYTENNESFFTNYGNELGALNISRDLMEEKDIMINPSNIFTITGKGKNLTMLLNVQDKRFEKWNQRKIDRVDLVDAASNLFKEAYEKNKDEFFHKYGKAEGAYNIAKELRKSGGYTKRINLHNLSQIMGKPSLVKGLMGVSDNRFDIEWKPRQLHMHLDTLEKMLDLLSQEYKDDPDSFFSIYGSATGCYTLAKKLREKDITIHLMRIGTIINKGDVLSRMLDIEDIRFNSLWKPKELTWSLSNLETVLNFLKSKYEENSNQFFERYGTEGGQLNLTRDLEALLKKQIGCLNTITGDGIHLSELLNIKDPRFETAWKPTVIINSGCDNMELILDFLKDRYKEDSEDFFRRYGRPSGLIEIARDIYKAKGVDLQLEPLKTLTQNGKKLATYMNLRDKRFEEAWHQKLLRGKFSEVETTLEHLAQKYFENPDDFLDDYGCVTGILKLATNMEALGEGVKNPAYLSHLINSRILEEQLGIKNDRLNTQFNPKLLLTNMEDTKTVLNRLKRQYQNNSDWFFEVYGSHLGKMILAKEVEMYNEVSYTHIGNIMGNKFLEEFLGVEDKRFKVNWFTKLDKHQLRELAIKGIAYLAKEKRLPEKSTVVDDELKEYITFRQIMRGLKSRGGAEGYYDTAMAINRDAMLYFVELFAPQHLASVTSFIDSDILEDKKTLRKLTSEPIPILKKEEQEYKPEILSSVYAPPMEGQISREDENLSPFEEFSFKTGKLLYSFDPTIRLEAKALLIQLGRQHYLYNYINRKKMDVAEVANKLFDITVSRYDPYLLMQKGKSKVLSFYSSLSSHAKWVMPQLNLSKKEARKYVSIETGGLDSGRLYEGTSPLKGFF